MASPHGLAGQFGYTSETTVGTGVTPTEFLPILSESVTNNFERVVSNGIRAGRLTRSQWKATRQTIAGNIEMELWNTDIAGLMRHMFGSVTTTGAGPYTHTYTPGDLVGKSMTIQVGRPDTSGTVRAFTWAGCKISNWSISADLGEICKLGIDIVAMSETTATALATASYDSSLAPFVFTEASVTLGGSAYPVTSLEISGDNSLTDRFQLGSATSREFLPNDFREYSGRLVGDFSSLTQYNLIANGTESALVATFNNGTQTLTITTNVRMDGDSPSLGGPGLVELPLSFVCTSTTSDAAAITAVLVNSESVATA